MTAADGGRRAGLRRKLPFMQRYFRIEHPGDVPPPDPKTIDVAVLDMNHGWPNLGHDSLVDSVLGDDARCREEQRCGIAVRVLSYDVRRYGMVPEAPAGGRLAIYLGTGGPGHIDPHANDGASPQSQGLREDPSWEAGLFRLFDAIAADRAAVLLAVCHSFGVMCRWSGIARPVFRGPEKGGKSSGVLENAWTAEAAAHPWFGRFVGPDGRLRILDNRLYDLIPEARPLPAGFLPIGYETLGIGGPRGDALTMLEFARDAAGEMPRIFGVNHHPEVVGRARQLELLEEKLRRGEVSPTWVAERREILTRRYPDEDSDGRLQHTSECTLLAPLRFHLYRELRQRAAALDVALDLHSLPA